jgi:hypothetical protein
MITRALVLTLFAMTALLSTAEAQWPNYPTPGVPRTADGKPDLSGSAPKRPDGKPDFSGVWQPRAGYTGNIAKDLKPGEVVFQPWAEKLYKHRVETQAKDDPQAYCVLSGVPRENVVPYPIKFLNAGNVIVILHEALHSYRQIFMDGRALPKNPNPAWMGYSIGRWEGDTLVIDSSGFVEGSWLDNEGHPGSEALHVIERFRRPDFGHLNLQLTIDDPKAYTKPWTVNLQFTAMPDAELIEYVCSENEKDLNHLVGKQ